MYFNSPEELSKLFPPPCLNSLSSTSLSSATIIPNTTLSFSLSETAKTPTELCLSCGHVSENLSPSALDEVMEGLDAIRAGVISPSQIIDSEYGEYTIGSFSLILPLKHTMQ